MNVPIYSVYADNFFLKSFYDERDAQLLQLTLTVFFLKNDLSHEVTIKCEVV